MMSNTRDDVLNEAINVLKEYMEKNELAQLNGYGAILLLEELKKK